MKRLFVMGIILSMVAAGLLVSVSANMMEDALAKFKAGADLAKVLEKIEEKQQKAAEKFKKVLAGQTDRNSNPFPFTKN